MLVATNVIPEGWQINLKNGIKRWQSPYNVKTPEWFNLNDLVSENVHVRMRKYKYRLVINSKGVKKERTHFKFS